MRASLSICALCFIFLCGCADRRSTVIVGSKNFPEQAILGEILAQQIEAHTNLRVERRFYLAGTYICNQALLAGRIDMYVEYTGTALSAVLKEPLQQNPEAVFKTVRAEYERRFNLLVEPPLGFNDSFAIVIRGADARAHHLRSISQATAYAGSWRPGFGYEFMERPDGYDGFAKAYGLKFAATPRIMDLGLLYRALESRQVDIIAGNTTDGQLLAGDFTALADDKHYFPPYQAVVIVRDALVRTHGQALETIAALSGRISGHDMQQMNYEAVGEKKDVAVIAREFLNSKRLE